MSLENKSGILRILGRELLVCNGDIIHNWNQIFLHRKHCKNEECPAKKVKIE